MWLLSIQSCFRSWLQDAKFVIASNNGMSLQTIVAYMIEISKSDSPAAALQACIFLKKILHVGYIRAIITTCLLKIDKRNVKHMGFSNVFLI